MKLVIDRTMWLRGEGADCSKLLRSSDGKMCCLGFLCLAHGMEGRKIEDVPSPMGIRTRYPTATIPEAINWLLGTGEDSGDCAKLMRYNDAQVAWDQESLGLMTPDQNLDEAREVAIARIFKRNGIEVQFIN